MCTRYISPDAAAIEHTWRIDRSTPWRGGELWPNRPGPFIRAERAAAQAAQAVVVGQWGLIPWFAKSPKLSFSTCNARSEELAAKASYQRPWQQGQRCIIPAESFFEPNWETGRHVPWRFRRADAALWGLAGLWNTWTDPSTGELFESYTLLTINADPHPLMSRMHKPDPKRPPEMQDKRSVVPIEAADAETWLSGSMAEATRLIRLAPLAAFEAEAADPAR